MTKYDLDSIKDWFKKHSMYWSLLSMFGLCAIVGQLIMLDGLYDGGDAYLPYSWEEKYPENQGKVEGHRYPSMFKTVIGAIFTAPFVVWSLTLPLNTLLLKIRRRDFFSGEQRPSKRELKMKEREQQVINATAALRKRERELDLEPYELGPINGNRL